MKSNAGITMTSLIVYIIAMMIIIGIVATLTSFFYTNVSNLEDNSQNASELTKFNMYFIEEVEKKGNTIIATGQDNTSITFSSGNTYQYQDKAIYRNNVRICEDIKVMQLQVDKEDNKVVITVLITIGKNMEYTKTTQYVMVENV